MEFVRGEDQCADILTKALAKLKFNDMKKKIGVQDSLRSNMKLRRENVG